MNAFRKKRQPAKGAVSPQPAKSPLQRIEQLEHAMQATMQALTETRQELAVLIPTMAAVEHILGTSVVAEARTRLRIAASLASLQTALDAGQLVQVDLATKDEDVVTAHEQDQDGKEVFGGFLMVRVKDLTQAAKDAFLGKGVGAEFLPEDGKGAKVVLTGVYGAPEPVTEDLVMATPEEMGPLSAAGEAAAVALAGLRPQADEATKEGS